MSASGSDHPSLNSPQPPVPRSSSSVAQTLSRPLLAGQAGYNSLGQSDALDAVAPAASTKKSAVYHVGLGSAYWGLVGEILFAWFTRKYVALGITDTLSAIGVDMPPLDPAVYGTNLSIAHPAIEVSADLLTLADFLANMGGFDPNSAAADLDKSLPDGFKKGMADYLKRCKNEFGTVGVTTLLMLVNFLAGAWADVEPLYQPLKDKIGLWSLGPISLVMYGGVSYYVFFCGQDVLNSVNFFLNKDLAIPSLPQQTLLQRVITRGEIAIPLQVAIEGHVQNINRMFAFAFLLGRLAEQVGLPVVGVWAAQFLGGASGFAVSLGTRYPISYVKYLGNENNPMYLIKAEWQKDFKASTKKSFAASMKDSVVDVCTHPLRSLMNVPIAGLAQSAMPAYFTGTRVAAFTAGMLAWESMLLPILAATAVGAVSYLPFKLANDLREMNIRILQQPKFKMMIHVEMAQHVKIHLDRCSEKLAELVAANDNSDDAKNAIKKAREDLTRAAKNLQKYSKIILEAGAQLNNAHSSDVAIEIHDDESSNDQVAIPVQGEQNANLGIDVNAAIAQAEIDIIYAGQSLTDANIVLPEEEAKAKPTLSTSGKALSLFSNFGSQTARVFTGISSYLGVIGPHMNKRDVVGSIGPALVLTAVNNGDYMGEKIDDSFASYRLLQAKQTAPRQEAPQQEADEAVVVHSRVSPGSA